MFPQSSEGLKMFMQISLFISWACLRWIQHITAVKYKSEVERQEWKENKSNRWYCYRRKL